MTKSRLLMLDDDPDVGAFVLNVAERLGYEICFTDRSDAFKDAFRSLCPDVVILDLAVPDTDGIEILQFLAGERSRSSILLMSGFDSRIREAARRLGDAYGLQMKGIVPKPVRVAELRTLLERLRNE